MGGGILYLKMILYNIFVNIFKVHESCNVPFFSCIHLYLGDWTSRQFIFGKAIASKTVQSLLQEKMGYKMNLYHTSMYLYDVSFNTITCFFPTKHTGQFVIW